MIAQCERRLWPALAAVVLLTGCGGRPLNLSTGAAAHQPGRPQSRVEKIDAALQAASGFLLSAQSADGSWKSDIYGQFKQGDALTPLVLVTLANLPDCPQRPLAIEKGIRFLQQFVGDDGKIRETDSGITYPVYTAAGAILALTAQDSAESQKDCRAWLKYLRDQQLAEPLGWQPSDAQYGGWSYAKQPTRKPPLDQPLSPLAEPNLSATLFALEALRASAAATDGPAIQKAIQFVERCQNYSADADAADSRFDDGGFFFIQDDAIRNKAGQAGVDGHGNRRYSSYGSATADGVRALLLCGLPPGNPRVQAALEWLKAHFAAAEHPGEYARDRQASREAVYFYYCCSFAKTMRAAAASGPSSPSEDWAESLADELLNRQRADGAWINSVMDVREDDPTVATCFAATALSICRMSIVGSQPAAAGE